MSTPRWLAATCDKSHRSQVFSVSDSVSCCAAANRWPTPTPPFPYRWALHPGQTAASCCSHSYTPAPSSLAANVHPSDCAPSSCRTLTQACRGGNGVLPTLGHNKRCTSSGSIRVTSRPDEESHLVETVGLRSGCLLFDCGPVTRPRPATCVAEGVKVVACCWASTSAAARS